MVLQLEDCVNVLKVLYPQFNFLFLFDHSCGHDREQENGLNEENMLKYYGGKQAYLRDSKINEEKGYLGPYEQILQPGNTQSVIFQPMDQGPFWMMPQE